MALSTRGHLVGLTAAMAIGSMLCRPVCACAQPATAPAPDGLYEGFSPLRLAVSGPIARPPPAMPRWLSSSSTGATSVITFEPERRVVWRLTYGMYGLVDKRTEVDGVEIHRSTFHYDGRGHLSEKRVTGRALPMSARVVFATDAHGAIVRRTETTTDPFTGAAKTMVSTVAPLPSRRGGRTMTTRVNGVLARRDRFDDADRMLETRFFTSDGRSAAIRYVRDARGGLSRVRRTLGGRTTDADFRARITSPPIRAEHMTLPVFAWAERHEVLLLLGAPVTSTDAGHGAERTIDDDYADASGCWLNQPSGFVSDATGLVERSAMRCICGFCVDAGLPWSVASHADVVDAIDLHFTNGPWVRIDGVAVTVEHEIATPAGFVAAGAVRVGDLVSRASGPPRPVQAVERLSDEERLGRNVRTTGGTFIVGDIVFRSEQAGRGLDCLGD